MFYTKCFLWNVYLTWLVSDSVWTLVSYLSFVSSPFSHRSVQVHVHDFCSELIPYHKLYCDYSFQTIMLGKLCQANKNKKEITFRRTDEGRSHARFFHLSRKPAQCDRQREEKKKGIVSFKIFSWSTATLHIYSLTSDLDPQFDCFI